MDRVFARCDRGAPHLPLLVLRATLSQRSCSTNLLEAVICSFVEKKGGGGESETSTPPAAETAATHSIPSPLVPRPSSSVIDISVLRSLTPSRARRANSLLQPLPPPRDLISIFWNFAASCARANSALLLASFAFFLHIRISPRSNFTSSRDGVQSSTDVVYISWLEVGAQFTFPPCSTRRENNTGLRS